MPDTAIIRTVLGNIKPLELGTASWQVMDAL